VMLGDDPVEGSLTKGGGGVPQFGEAWARL
jgi:hypothetical protein